jgi:methylmalonic aciduria homocystinuria type C protein
VNATTLLAGAGFDLVHPFDARAIARELALPALADPARPCGLIVGHTRRFWPHFLELRRRDAALAASRDPIDEHTERTCAQIAGAAAFYPHRLYDGAFLPFQRIAAAAGFGTLAPSNLLVHPAYGPWFGLRAIVLTAGTPAMLALPRAACDCADRCAAAFAHARARSDWRAWLAVRDACCIGREHRYSDDQIEYHYTKRLDLLR